MVYDELEMLQRMKHPHIVKFEDWFESRVSLIWSGVEGYDSSHAFRTNITSSHNWLLEENCSIGSARREDSQRRMHHRLFDRSLRRSITSTITMSFIEVSILNVVFAPQN